MRLAVMKFTTLALTMLVTAIPIIGWSACNKDGQDTLKSNGGAAAQSGGALTASGGQNTGMGGSKNAGGVANEGSAMVQGSKVTSGGSAGSGEFVSMGGLANKGGSGITGGVTSPGGTTSTGASPQQGGATSPGNPVRTGGSVVTCPPSSSQKLPAFPGAEGFGAFAKGGRGGDVYHVTNLNSSGPGSLAYGIENTPAQGRTIVFDISGYANISGVLRGTKPFLTIAGQTAPGDGFGLKNGTFLLSAGDVIFRHLRFRNGNSADSVNMDAKAVNFIWDHCDMMFSHDENMSSFKDPPQNMTYQYSINAWGLETHSCGGLWDQKKATAHHTLWAHNHTRNPKARSDLLDWVNNVTFDWDIGFIMGDSETPMHWRANVRGSYFISGTAKTNALEKALTASDGKPNFHLFMDDCVLDGNVNGVLDVTKKDYEMASGNYGKTTAPFPLTDNFEPVSSSNPIVGLPVTQDDSLTAYKKVVSSVGPLRLDVNYEKPLRDELDALLIKDLVTQNHRHLTYGQIGANGLPNGGFGQLESKPAPKDTDADGMPDFWELAVGLDPNQDDHNAPIPCVFAYVPGNVGYTALEDYLQWLAIPHAVMAKRTTTADAHQDVDLVRFTSGLKPGAVYTIVSATNGTASILPDGKTARFVPEVNFAGRAGFTFKGTDSDNSTISSEVGVLVSGT
jgi:hypothetical protein